MPVINSIAALHEEVTGWRRDFHEHPELVFDVHRTAGLVVERLKAFGVDEVVTGVGRTGVVGIIKGRTNHSGKVVGLRADMDALPVLEITGKPYASKTPGKMHACGHDGHTSMLLGAAKYLAETRNFDGTVVLIFQPAEEGGGGARAMVDDGLMERFGVQQVYGMHNMPNMPAGHFGIRHGPLMASGDKIAIEIQGKGGHGAAPDRSLDPIVVAAAIIQATQTIAARVNDPLDSAVISITSVKAGETFNVIPDRLKMIGTVRTLNPAVQAMIETQLRRIVEGIAKAHGASATLTFIPSVPVTANHRHETDLAIAVARDVAGEAGVDPATPPIMVGEDFSHMLNARPGAFIFLGVGDGPGLHQPDYDFNDAVLPVGMSYWARLVETSMPA